MTKSGMTGMLASVTSIAEARMVAEAGADIVDLKNPAQGALGALPTEVIREIVEFINGRHPVSATVGDLPMNPEMLFDAVARTAATGVDIVKVGFFGRKNHEECIKALASTAQQGTKIVAVMFADQKPDFALLPMLAEAGFYGAMIDTADKASGGLRNWMGNDQLREFVGGCKRLGLFTGLAGALRLPDIKPLAELGADYLGFRGALCGGEQRESQIDHHRLVAVCKAVAQMQHTEHSALFQDCIA